MLGGHQHHPLQDVTPLSGSLLSPCALTLLMTNTPSTSTQTCACSCCPICLHLMLLECKPCMLPDSSMLGGHQHHPLQDVTPLSGSLLSPCALTLLMTNTPYASTQTCCACFCCLACLSFSEFESKSCMLPESSMLGELHNHTLQDVRPLSGSLLSP